MTPSSGAASAKFRANLLISAALIAIPFSAAAQEAPAAGTPSDAAASGLEDIVVTAERREQSLQTVPISATVLTSADLTRRGVTSVADVQQVAPSVAINTINRSTFINIRGVGLALSAPTSSAGVAFYLDGLFIPSDQTIGLSFYDVGTVEVLRGPQGTLTGQNSTGGAIYVRTPEPQFNELSGFIEQTVGNYNLTRSTLAVNVPIADTIALRVAGTYESRGSFSQQIGTSLSTPGNQDFYGLRANLRFDPTPNIKLNLRYERFDSDNDNNAVTNRNLLPTTGPFRVQEDTISFLRIKGQRVAGEARIDIADAVQWRTHASYQDSSTYDQADGDRTSTDLPIPAALPVTAANRALFPGRVSNILTSQSYFIAETNLVSTYKSALQWVLGGFYLDGDVPLDQFRDERNTRTFVSATNSLVLRIRNRTKAVFGQINLKPIDAVELIAGARYSEDTQEMDRVAPVGASGVANSDKVTGRLAVNVFPMQDVMLYASVSRGYKAGGVNAAAGTPNFAPEENTSYEAGFKVTALDRHLRVNGSVFKSDYKDVQFSSLVSGFPTVQNAASGKAWGAELEVTGQFGGLSFNGGVGYLDAKFATSVCLNNTNNPAGTPALCPVGTTATTADELVPEGRVLPYSPKWTINAGIQYEADLGNGMTLTPRIQYSHTADQVATPFPATLANGVPLTLVPSRDIFDARLTFVPNKRFRFEIYGSNIFDTTYIASQVNDATSARGGILWGAPRQYGLRATVQLGPL